MRQNKKATIRKYRNVKVILGNYKNILISSWEENATTERLSGTNNDVRLADQVKDFIRKTYLLNDTFNSLGGSNDSLHT